MKLFVNRLSAAALALVASVSPALTFATTAPTPTPIDTAGAVAQIGEIGTAVAAIGGALIAAAAIAVAFKWAKAAIFG